MECNIDMECSIDMNIQHGHGMQYGYGHAARTWTCSMVMDMQYGHGHAARIWSCGMDLDSGHAWMHGCRNADKSQSGIVSLLLVYNASAFRHYGQSGTAGHGLIRSCPAMEKRAGGSLYQHWCSGCNLGESKGEARREQGVRTLGCCIAVRCATTEHMYSPHSEILVLLG
jgi:hypothetical protein